MHFVCIFSDIGNVSLSSECRGNLMNVLTGEKFYPVCNASFGDEEAQVVCRVQLTRTSARFAMTL